MLGRPPGAFVPAPGGWGGKGGTDVVLKTATTGAVRAAMLLAYQAVMEKPRAKSRRR